ncbi:carboxylating nicotinate-nucleotide diphosphorylase [Rubidibacter lacunae]|uniref:carboxylating nicotinate-nucleotide diphosphorylase n=1 Tax=Rubidibacter lacunae TaxID=582514 RepID=UPI0018DD4EF7|nr:carboxylating nicotinate-nucleotide diphosphorylase [Rubidibacter lacunae]
MLPPWIALEPLLRAWLLEDVGRGDRATSGILSGSARPGQAAWIAKEAGVVAGLPIAARAFQLLDPDARLQVLVGEGETCERGQAIAEIEGSLEALLTGERVALNVAMRASGIATRTRQFVARIADLPSRLTDTRKTTPGLRAIEKYATQVGGALNHRCGLDDAAMIKDNHIRAAGGIAAAVAAVRATLPYPLTVEVETSTLGEVKDAIAAGADIIMLDNMSVEQMRTAVERIRTDAPRTAIEASGNVTLETIRAIATTGVDFISSSAPITRSTWLDLSMQLR